jgi:hypothetical protein
MPILSVWTPLGGVLGIVAPLALAASAGTALVVDLDPAGPAYPGETSLARLVAEGPRKADLSPARRGVAVLRNGGIPAGDARRVVDALGLGWPYVVLRHRPGADRPSGPGLVPVRPLLPGGLLSEDERPSVYQRCGARVRAAGPGPVLPAPRSATVQAFLEGRVPVLDRWVRSWTQVWEAAWM